MPKTLNHQEELIKALKKNPEEAAAYIWALFDEEEPEPELLSLVFHNVGEALGELNMSPEAALLHLQQLDELLQKQGSDAIYGLAEWLKPLGLELTAAVRYYRNNSHAYREKTVENTETEVMRKVSKSYQEELIHELKENPEEAADYIWAILDEEDPEPELLPSALRDVGEALGELNMSPEAAKLHLEKLDELFQKQGSDAIYGLAEWLKPLGLELTAAVRNNGNNTETNSAETEELVVQ
jgi:DNA-binding phage protein